MTARQVCACCGKAARDMRYIDHEIVCLPCAGPPTVDNPNNGPRVCWKCREPVDHRSNELLCEPCSYQARVSP